MASELNVGSVTATAGNSTFTQAASDQSGAAAVKAVGTSYSTNKALHAYINTANANRSLLYVENSAGAVLDINGTGLATFANGIAVTTGGVAFPATQSASADANTLDDYEEGFYEPTITCATSGGYTTSSYTQLSYTKIGRLVHVQGYINVSAEDGTPSGDISMSLPFAVAALVGDSEYTAGNIHLRDHGGTVDNINLIAMGSGSTASFSKVAEDGTQVWMDETNVDTAFNFWVGLTYCA